MTTSQIFESIKKAPSEENLALMIEYLDQKLMTLKEEKENYLTWASQLLQVGQGIAIREAQIIEYQKLLDEERKAFEYEKQLFGMNFIMTREEDQKRLFIINESLQTRTMKDKILKLEQNLSLRFKLLNMEKDQFNVKIQESIKFLIDSQNIYTNLISIAQKNN